MFFLFAQKILEIYSFFSEALEKRPNIFIQYCGTALNISFGIRRNEQEQQN